MDEEQLIRRATNKDEEAFRFIVEKYKALIYAISYNILKDKSEAENAAQETFLQVYRSLYKYEYKGFKTWISKIAINKSLDIKRKLKPLEFTNSYSLDEINEIIPDNEMSIEDLMIIKERKEQMLGIVNSLSSSYQETIKDYYYNHMSYDEIAIKHNVAKKTVESRLYRGKKIIKEKWKEEVL
ncbi:MAG: RNA polymerase sigma factor [Clostridiaceae bacterium]